MTGHRHRIVVSSEATALPISATVYVPDKDLAISAVLTDIVPILASTSFDVIKLAEQPVILEMFPTVKQ